MAEEYKRNFYVVYVTRGDIVKITIFDVCINCNFFPKIYAIQMNSIINHSVFCRKTYIVFVFNLKVLNVPFHSKKITLFNQILAFVHSDMRKLRGMSEQSHYIIGTVCLNIWVIRHRCEAEDLALPR